MQVKKANFIQVTQVRPDSKGRVTLGKLSEGISSFVVLKDSEGRLLFEPLAEIPAREKWLFDNPEALSSVKRGLADAKAGRTKSVGSFAKYLDQDEDKES